jgi:alpha-D-xyloside xylohydrolase
VPWNFDDEASDVLRSFTKLKNKLMPYIYGQAVKAHRKGVPVLRLMFMEFPEDPACAPLDLQYMLGDSLLVAPIFNDEGRVTYYLPKGTWTNIITGQKHEGGGFVTEVHDYFSLPLMIRENTVLPVGTIDDRPDYNYADNMALELYCIKDGAQIKVEIPDLNGEIAAVAKVAREGDDITIEVSKDSNWGVKYAGKLIRAEGKRLVIKAEK